MTVFAVLGRVVVFFLSFAAGTLVAWLLAGTAGEAFQASRPVSVTHDFGSGTAACKTKWRRESELSPDPGIISQLMIVSKPRPGYTDDARINNVQGTVKLRVEFLASGRIGSVEPVHGLPDGLTEQAIEAARRIQFRPKQENGKPVTVTRQIEYTFSIY